MLYKLSKCRVSPLFAIRIEKKRTIIMISVSFDLEATMSLETLLQRAEKAGLRISVYIKCVLVLTQVHC